MTKPEHLNHQQLRLFMTAGELMDHPTGDSNTLASLNQDTALRNRKSDESVYGSETRTHGYRRTSGISLQQSIKKKGVQKPIELTFLGDHSTPVITDGNHRIVAANEINPNMYIIPKYLEMPESLAWTPSDFKEGAPDYPVSSRHLKSSKDKE